MPKCIFVSDLHLFAARSDADRYRAAIDAAAAEASHLVLGGDIFDFHWAVHHTEREAVAWAVAWLRRLADGCPSCQFHYLLGNHDHHRLLIDQLIELEQTVDNLVWHRFHTRLGQCAFLHGDVVDRPMSAEALATARATRMARKKRHATHSRIYDLAILGRLHKPVPHLVHRNRTVARRIYRYLEEVQLGPRDGVTDVYFGHIHRPISAYRYGGLRFHTGGAPIKGLKYRILEAEIAEA